MIKEIFKEDIIREGPKTIRVKLINWLELNYDIESDYYWIDIYKPTTTMWTKLLDPKVSESWLIALRQLRDRVCLEW